MLRYFFTIQKLWQYRHKLRRYLSNKALAELRELKIDYLKKNNIKILVLDFDGVLNSHGENIIQNNIFTWLKNIITIMPDIKIYILTRMFDIGNYTIRKLKIIVFIGLQKEGNLTISLHKWKQ